MDKQKKRAPSHWLKAQSHLGKKWLMLTIATALLSGVFLLLQTAALAHILHELIIEKTNKNELALAFIWLLAAILGRAACSYYKEKNAYFIGEAVRVKTRALLFDKLERMGPSSIQAKTPAALASLLLEQVDKLQDFFARYLPQLAISIFIPLMILVAIFPLNWAAGLIFVVTAPLIPIFMILVGMGAAEANRRNLKALERLSGFFYDRLRGLTTIKLFAQTQNESQHLKTASDEFRKRTMEVLRLAFLSTAVLEFFTALSIALTAVYIGFSYLGELNFGHYGSPISLFIGLFILLLAPEFYQPLRELGSFYHAKSEALAAAEAITEFLASTEPEQPTAINQAMPKDIALKAEELCIYSPDGNLLAGPLTFSIKAGEKIAIIGQSGSGKTSLLNALLGFLPYQGSLKISGIELNQMAMADWRKQIAWVGQNPELFYGKISENIRLGAPEISHTELEKVAKAAHASEFIDKLDLGFDYRIGDSARGLSVGQAQRIALARALLQDGKCWLLDEPTASLDIESEKLIMASLEQATKDKTTLWVTHRLDLLAECSQIFILEQGKLRFQGSYQALVQSGALQVINSVNEG